MKIALLLVSFAAPVFAAPTWHETLPAALAEAKARKTPVLIDFEAPWCYSCYYMQKKVLSQPRFAAAAKTLALAKIDVDKAEGHALRSKHAVTALPSYLVLDADGKELGRILGEQTEDDFLARLSAIVGAGKPVDDAKQLALRERLKKGDLAAFSLLLAEPVSCETAYDVMNADSALEKLPADDARTLRLEAKPRLEELAAKRLLVPAAKRCADFRSGVVALAELYEKLGLDPERQKLLTDALETLSFPKAPGEDRNRDDDLRLFLEMKGEELPVIAWYEKLIAAYPADYVYAYRYAKFLEGKKHPSQALPWIEKADKLAYGANRLQVTLVRAKILTALGRKPEAIKLAKRDLKAAGGKFPAVEKPLASWLDAQK